jgi:hypothetical protein
LNDLVGYDWITPGPTAPRHQALERIFGTTRRAPRITIETTSMQIHRNMLASTDRLALMSLMGARFNDRHLRDPTLPVRYLTRSDGVVRRTDWRPTGIHLQIMELLRYCAQRFALGDLPAGCKFGYPSQTARGSGRRSSGRLEMAAGGEHGPRRACDGTSCGSQVLVLRRMSYDSSRQSYWHGRPFRPRLAPNKIKAGRGNPGSAEA